MEIRLSTTVPEKISDASLRGRVLSTLNKHGRKLLLDLESTTATWDNKPEFTVDVGYSGGDAFVAATTDNPIWHYLDEGTDYRWALMSNPFVAKTEPGVVGSFTGEGHAVLRGATAMQKHGLGPQPGIEARRWSETIQDNREQSFFDDIDDILAELFT